MKKLYTFDKELLAYKRVNMTKIILICLFSLASIITLCSFICRGETKYIHGEKEINLSTDRDFTEERLIEEIKKYNYRWPELILAQAKLESANYTSLVFKNNHNLFGLRVASSRTTTSKVSELGHAKYNDWMSSLADRSLFEAAYLRNIQTKQQYLEYLDRNYAEGANYSKTLQDIVKKNNLKELFK